MKNSDIKVVSLRLPADVWSRVRGDAQRMGRSMNAQILYVLRGGPSVEPREGVMPSVSEQPRVRGPSNSKRAVTGAAHPLNATVEPRGVYGAHGAADMAVEPNFKKGNKK